MNILTSLFSRPTANRRTPEPNTPSAAAPILRNTPAQQAFPLVLQHFPEVIDDAIDRFDSASNPEDKLDTYGILKFFLNQSGKPDHRYQEKFPLLAQALRMELPIDRLPQLTSQSNPLTTDLFGDTVLDYAAKHGNPRLLEQLLQRLPAGNIREERVAELRELAPQQEARKQELRRNTPEERQAAFRQALDSRGRTLDLFALAATDATHRLFQTPTRPGGSPIRPTELTGSPQKLSALIQANARLNQADAHGRTVLHHALLNDRRETAAMLIETGAANVNQPDKQGCTALHLAAALDRPKLAEKLVQAGADINQPDKNGRTALHVAAQHGGLFTLDALLQPNTNIHAQDHEGRTPLHIAALHDKAFQAAALLRKGADINQQDFQRRTPLHLAADSGSINALSALNRLLAAEQVEVNLPDQEEQTPLHLAAIKGHPNKIQALLRANANLNLPDKLGRTPLHLAAMHGRSRAISVLTQVGAEINARDKGGRTPLHWAAKNGHHHAVQELLNGNANPRLQDKLGYTARQLALRGPSPQIADLLSENS